MVRGPAWLGGGGFGPEGSVVATVVVLAATVLCWRARWLAPAPAVRAARPLAIALAGPFRGGGRGAA